MVKDWVGMRKESSSSFNGTKKGSKKKHLHIKKSI